LKERAMTIGTRQVLAFTMVALVACASGGTAPEATPGPDAGVAAQAAAGELAGPRWNLVRLGTRTMTGLGEDRSPHLLFDGATLRVAGSGGCNRLMGPYTVDGSMMRLGPLAGTMMACQQQIMEQEQAFLKALEATESWRIVNGQLELRGTDRQLLARFARGEPFPH
jgi:copper homeostasis protein (lipoprotein)